MSNPIIIYATLKNEHLELHVNSMNDLFKLFRGNERMLKTLCMAINPKNSYIVKSNVPKEMVIKFWNYITGQNKEIDLFNKFVYMQLGHEFGINIEEMIIRQRKIERLRKCAKPMLKRI